MSEWVSEWLSVWVSECLIESVSEQVSEWVCVCVWSLCSGPPVYWIFLFTCTGGLGASKWGDQLKNFSENTILTRLTWTDLGKMDENESLQPDSVVPERAATHALDGDALTHSLTHSHTDSSLTHSRTHSYIDSLTYSLPLASSLTHWHAHELSDCLFHLSISHSFTHSFIHSLIHSLTYILIVIFVLVEQPSIKAQTPVRRSSVIRGLLNSFNSLTSSAEYRDGNTDENEITIASMSASADDYDTSMR